MPRIKVRRKPQRRHLTLEDLEHRVVLSTVGEADLPHVPIAVDVATQHQPGSDAEADESTAADARPDSVGIVEAHPRPHHTPKKPASL